MEVNNNNVSENGNNKNQSENGNNKGLVGDDDDVDEGEDIEILKRRISSHPLFGRLIETHFNCLKVGGGAVGEDGTANSNSSNLVNLQATIPSSSEFDRFMEAYCVTLSKLKQALEEQAKETGSFIDAMNVRLRELCETRSPSPNK